MSGQLPKGILQEKVTVRLFDALIMYMLWLSFILGFIFVIVVIVFFCMVVYDNDF